MISQFITLFSKITLVLYRGIHCMIDLYQSDLNSDTCFMHFEYNIHWQNLSKNSWQLVSEFANSN